MRFSKIDKELSVYERKKVVIWGGIHREGHFIYEILKRNHIDTYAFVTRSTTYKNNEQMFLDGCKILSPEQLERLYKTDTNIVVQIGSPKEDKIKRQLLDMGIDHYVSYSEAMLIPLLEQYLLFSEKPDIHKYYLNHIYEPYMSTNVMWKQYFSRKKDTKRCVILCAPPKTGNYTVFTTAERYAEDDVMVLESWHSSRHIKEFEHILDMPVKIVTAVREPISQNISDLFQIAYTKLWDQGECWENDCNALFEKFINIARGKETENCVYLEYMRANQYPMTIQDYFESQFQEILGINLFDYPFDKEKGYSIISVNGLEIFIYQLEKLNLIYKELFRFIGLKEDAKLLSENCSTGKYYDENYQDAKREIRFSKEYFDWSFHSPYLKHFYSEDDIERFKDKWRGNIFSH